MQRLGRTAGALLAAGTTILAMACAEQAGITAPFAAEHATFNRGGRGPDKFTFEPLAASATCTNGGNPAELLVLPDGYRQTSLASEPQFADVPDMNTQNETGRDAGRYVYRTHETGSNGSVSVTDLRTGVTRTIAQRTDWEALDGITWTPWGTVLFAEETNASSRRDPAVPQAVGGLVYEIILSPSDLMTATAVIARPAIGAKSHEGMRFDAEGNLYSISERTPGYIYKFVPDRRGDLSSGQTYVLRIIESTGDRTGTAEWVALDRAAVQIDASVAGDAVNATGYGRPEDIEIATSTGDERGPDHMMYVAITSEHRVLAIDLGNPHSRGKSSRVTVSDYVRVGVNATADFNMPDNMALDHWGNLYITEDPGGTFSGGKRAGDDIWVATPNRGKKGSATSVTRFASLTDCDAEPTGVYFDLDRGGLFVNIQHRGGDRVDQALFVDLARRR